MVARSDSVDDELAAIVQHLDINYTPEAKLHANSQSNGDATVEALGRVDKSLPGVPEALQDEEAPSNGAGEPSESAKPVGGDSDGLDYPTLSSRTHSLSREVTALLDRLYQIQELRHASPIPPAQLDPILASLTASIPALRQNLVQLQSDVYAYPGGDGRDLADGVEEALVEFKKAEEGWRGLKEGVKEDEWVGEFKTTADQVDGMMEPLQKSLAECRQYLDRITRSSVPIPDKAELEDQPSVRGLEKLVRDHESLKRTYVSSTNRTLKKIDKDITERRIKNGAALRRFNEMGQRWVALQTQLNNLDSRVQRVLSQITTHPTMEFLANSHAHSSTDDMEMLADEAPPSDYFGRALPRPAAPGYGHAGGKRTPRSSISSNLSASSARSLARRAGQQGSPSAYPGVGSSSGPGAGGTPPGSTAGRTLTRRTSLASIGSATTSATAAATARAPGTPGDRPRWNSSPKVVHEPAVQPVPAGPWQTPTANRTKTFPQSAGPGAGAGAGAGRAGRVGSPTPSGSSVVSSAGSRRLSRLPVYSPKAPRSSAGGAGAGALSPRSDASDMEYMSVPGLSLPPPTTPGGGRGGHGASHLERARMGLKTPEPLAGGRPRLSSSFSALQPRLSAGGPGSGPPTLSTPGHGRSYSTPRTAPAPGAGGRPSLSSRAPPSSFYSPTPTPSARPSSRLSLMSYAAADSRPGAPPLQPFTPSPHDHLDQLVWSTLVAEGFDKGFVTYRLDAPLRRGQRMREGEEWKGEYQFGAGEKVTPVKVLSLGGRRPGEGKREKVMVRTGGKWVELAELLRKRMDVMEVME
ncbi:hypothetical protein IAT38_000851 [Cryptococcus sp. DSM 104549]